MTEYVGVGGAWKQALAQWVGVGGVWKPVVAKWVGVGGVWKLATIPMSAVASPIAGYASGASASGTVTSSGDAGVIVTGGSGTVTCSWVRTSTSSGNSPTIVGASTSVAPTMEATVTNNVNSVSTWSAVVTDTYTGEVANVTGVVVTLDWDIES
jgi:hypothetical protein